MVFETKTYWLTGRQSQCDFDFDFDLCLVSWKVSLWREDLVGAATVVSSVRESAKKRLEPGGRGIAIVGAVTRKRLVAHLEH
jgi:hypothetical protein